MIQLNYHNAHVAVRIKGEVSETDLEANQLIGTLCTIEVTRYVRYGNKTRRKQVFLNYYKKYQFPSGWYHYITSELMKSDLPFEVVPQNTKWDIQDNPVDPRARYYQKDGIQAVRDYFRGIIKHPTGSGKTFTALQVARNTGLPTLFMVPTRVLLYQTYDVFREEFGGDVVGVVGDGEFDHRPITIATAQTLYSRKETPECKRLLDSTGLLILDEAHRTNRSDRKKKGEPAPPKLENMYFEVAQLCDAQFRIGVTATPGNPGSQSRFLLEGVTGPVIHTVSVPELVEKGFLAEPRVVFLVHDVVTRQERNYRKKKSILIEDFLYKTLISRLCLKTQSLNLSTLVACDEIVKQVEPYSLLVPGSEVLVGRKTSKEETIEKLDKFKKKEIKVLFSTVMKEGVDIPSMDVIIVPFGGKEPRSVIQKAGRVLRPSSGKNEGLIIDFYHRDSSTLEKHSKARMEQYVMEGYQVEIAESIEEIFDEQTETAS